MNGNELQKLLDSAGFTQVGAARELGMDDRTMRRYIAMDESIPKTVEYAVRWITYQAKQRNKN